METNLAHMSTRAALPLPASDLYSFKVNGFNDGVVNVSLDLPEPMLYAFSALLDSLSSSFRFLQFKTKCVKAEAMVHDPVAIERRRKSFRAYSKRVLDRYDKFFKDCHNVDDAIRQTKAFFNSRSENINCEDIRLIIRPHGRLSKKYLRQFS